MGLEFKIIQVEGKELDRITCDRCGKDIPKHSEGQWNPYGESFSSYHQPSFDDFFLLRHSWGYNSNKDGERHEAVLCEPCYDAVFSGVKITITSNF